MQKLQLTIPEPCHQDWQQMTPTEQGRFCNACTKEVIDFSMMTDTEVLNYFTTGTHEKVCGRALPTQLDREISRPKEPKKRLFWYWNYVVMFFMFFAKGNNAKAQGGVKAKTEVVPFRNDDAKQQQTIIKRDTVISTKRVVAGRVTDTAGIAISFATVKIKGSNTGISADAAGRFTLSLKSGDVLSVTTASFKELIVPVGEQKELNIVLEKSNNQFLSGDVVIVATLGGMSWSDNYYTPKPNQKLKAQLQVTDELTGQPIDKARITVVGGDYNREDTVYTDRKGKYKLKGIRRYDQYFVRVDAEGYEGNEFTISYKDVENSNKEWEVSLRKQKAVALKTEGATKISVANTKPGNEQSIRLGGISATSIAKDPLYVIDGVIKKSINDISPDEIEDITILRGPDAAALYGTDGSAGAIIITTRKEKIKNLDTVVVSTYGTTTGKLVCTTTTTTSVMGGMVRGYTIKSGIVDSLKMMATKITGAIKIYPNPVQRGSVFNVALKLKETGLHQIQITDVMGRAVLQKQFTATSKEFIEKIVTGDSWSAGVYYISIFNSKNQLENKNSFIVQ